MIESEVLKISRLTSRSCCQNLIFCFWAKRFGCVAQRFPLLDHWGFYILDSDFNKICSSNLSSKKWTSFAFFPILSQIIAIIFEFHILMNFFPKVCQVKFMLSWIFYHNFTKVTHGSHTMAKYGPVYDFQGVIQGWGPHHFTDSLWLPGHPFVFMLQRMTFMFSYLTTNDSVSNHWFFSWRSNGVKNKHIKAQNSNSNITKILELSSNVLIKTFLKFYLVYYPFYSKLVRLKLQRLWRAVSGSIWLKLNFQQFLIKLKNVLRQNFLFKKFSDHLEAADVLNRKVIWLSNLFSHDLK